MHGISRPYLAPLLTLSPVTSAKPLFSERKTLLALGCTAHAHIVGGLQMQQCLIFSDINA